MDVCGIWTHGCCQSGAACPYGHQANKSALPRPPPSERVCMFFLRGHCMRGALCTFTHSESSPDITQDAGSRAKIVCKHFLAGKCFQGIDCPYQHDEGVLHLDEDRDNFERSIFGAMVVFQDGACVSKVSLPWEFSSVRLTLLPVGSTPASISVLLGEMEFKVAPECIRVESDKAASIAVVTVEDAAFAMRLCKKLEAETSTSPYRTLIRAAAIPSSFLAQISLRHVSFTKVLVTLDAPTRPVRLCYATYEGALQAATGFNDGSMTLHGNNVSAATPEWSGSQLHPDTWVVLLHDVPLNQSWRDVEAAFGENDAPWIETLKPGFSVETAMRVSSLLNNLGSVELQMYPRASKSVSKIRARFTNEGNAREAVETLNAPSHDFLRQGSLKVQLLSTCSLKIETKKYEASKHSILPRKTKDMDIRSYAHDTKFTIVKIEGGCAEEVAVATSDIENLLAGAILNDRDNVTPLWHPSLFTDSKVTDFLKHLEKTYQIVIIRDKRKRELRLVGGSYHSVRADLLDDFANRTKNIPHRLELQDRQFSWALRGGMDEIRALLNQDGNSASLDITSHPRTMLIMGSLETYEQAKELVGNSGSGKATSTAKQEEEVICHVCLGAPENTILTKCEHTYCHDCFENLCINRAADSEDGIRCIGDNNQCKAVLALEDIDAHLSSTSFEKILNLSMKAHVQRHPDSFRYCPSPNCDHIYRVTGLAAKHTCTKCFEVTCMACHQQHRSAVTCAQANAIHEAFVAYKAEHDVKDCPKCNTPIEKNDGCQHMECMICKVHICWICMETFKASGDCYTHLNETHPEVNEVLVEAADW